MFVLAPTPRTIMNVQCSICLKIPCNYIFFNAGSVMKLDAPAITCRFDHIEDSDDDKEPEQPEEEPRHPEEPNNPTDEQRRDLKLKFPGGICHAGHGFCMVLYCGIVHSLLMSFTCFLFVTV